MTIFYLWADGACQPNPGIGGWSYLIKYDTFTIQDYGSNPASTNNRMELTGLLRGLESFQKHSDDNDQLIIELDSKYVLDGMQNWSINWVKQNWIKKDGKPVLNDDLWKKIRTLLDIIGQRIQYKHVRGHIGHEENEICDQYAVKAIQEYKCNF